jgi:hypothetical protein
VFVTLCVGCGGSVKRGAQTKRRIITRPAQLNTK